MDLPKIKKENLTQDLREVVGDCDLEFESIVDPSDVVSIPSHMKDFYQDKLTTAQRLVESRKRQEELRKKVRRP